MSRTRRDIFVKGLGNLYVRETFPTEADDFSDVGFLGETKFSDIYDIEDIRDERGFLINSLEKGQMVSITSQLLQSSKEQIDFMKDAKTQYHSLRYFGIERSNLFKYFAFDIARIIPGAEMEFKPALRRIQLKANALKQQELTFDVPMYYILETQKEMRIVNLQFWADPRQGLNYSNSKILDVSGFGRHGTVSSDFATIWQTSATPTYFLRLDGTNDDISYGNVLNVNDTKDFAFEMWVRIKGADASLQEIFSKKTDDTDGSIGYRLERTAANKIEFKISDGTNTATVVTSASVLVDTWKKIGLYADRNGNAQLFLNGVADGSAVDISGVTGDLTNAVDLVVGKLSTGFGQIDVGAFRWYTYGAASLPSDFATIDADHFTAERSYYGV